MLFSLDQIAALAREHFHLDVTVKPLPGEIDLNYYVETPSGSAFTLKIANPNEQVAQLELQNAVISHLAAANLGLEVPVVVPSVKKEQITVIIAPDGSRRYLRLLTWIKGRCFADVNPHTPELLERVGELCGKLCLALADFDHPGAHRFIKWDPSQAGWTGKDLHHIADAEKRELAQFFLQTFENQAVPLLPHLRQSVNYNDANDYNILVDFHPTNPAVPGVIDFGDVVYTHTINDLAIAAAYIAMDKPDPLSAIMDLTRGFHRIFPITEQEAEVLYAMIGARLLISVTCSAINISAHPENEYLQISDRPAWALMEKLHQIPPALFHAAIRYACGWEPCPKHTAFVEWAKNAAVCPVVEEATGWNRTSAWDGTSAWDIKSHATEEKSHSHSHSHSIFLDLSVGSADLGTYADIEDAQRLHRHILAQHTDEHGVVHPAIGRYNEVRPFYTTDAYAVEGNHGPEWRTVHIGLDIFLPPGTPVMAPLEGIVHSFQDNANDRDYGPTIILEHRIDSINLVFYTLYGHLTRTSLAGLQVGQVIKAGEAFCQIGPMPENGNWSPHLHLQVMLDDLGKKGDFPGVAFPSKREIWTSLCPDPWLLLTGKASEQPVGRSADDILQYRKTHLGKNLSVSYKKPLKMLRGWRQYLFDDTGRRYLDTVNNVAHVGHEHPSVVRAGQRQMAVLNTNTRYLHDNIVAFTEALLSTFQKPLEVAFIVNSGSEANELAMRLAKNYTGSSEMLVSEIGYHGNTQGCVAVSSYKFDGPGGSGAPDYVHVMPIPDTFRGIYRGNTAETGLQYAGHVREAIAKLSQQGRKPAALLIESIISCGGQVPLPPQYLKTAVDAVRAAGGVYIADEVQTGCGRHGQHFWAFEEHGVTPDIVTIGKPIGNGHPLGVVVTTKAIADAFANGMEYFNTFGGNPVSCAVGLEVLRVIKAEGLQQNALETGQYLIEGLHQLADQYPIIGDVRGAGLFLGFELVKDRSTLEPAEAATTYLANRMRELGILMSTDGPYHNVLKIKPPIVFDRKDADFLLGMLERVMKEGGLFLG